MQREVKELIDENTIIAAHEIGHQMIGFARGLSTTQVTIRRGSEYLPFVEFNPDQASVSHRQKAEALAAGWAAEAYLLSQHRDKPFNTAALLLKFFAASSGTGWPTGLLLRDRRDFGHIARLDVRLVQWVLPVRQLISLAKEIDRRKSLFFSLIDILVAERILRAEVLNELMAGTPWSLELQTRNRSDVLDADWNEFSKPTGQ